MPNAVLVKYADSIRLESGVLAGYNVITIRRFLIAIGVAILTLL